MRQLVGGVHLRYNQIPYHLIGQPTKWRIIILQKFSHRSESSKPHIRLPILGVQHWEEEPPERLALKASRAWLQELSRTGGNTDSTLGGCTPGPRAKVDFLGARPTSWSWRVSWGGRGWLCLTLGHGRWWQRYQVVFICELLLEADILLGSLAPRPGPTQQHVGSSARMPQAKQPTGWEHNPTLQQTGCLKTSWAHSHL